MERVVTKTLAEIYLKQGHYQEAYEMFQVLSQKDPTDQEIKKKLEELEEKLHFSTHSPYSYSRSKEERIRRLEQWLANIRKGKRS